MVDFYGFSIATVPCVVVIVYGIIEFMKHFFFKNSEKFNKYTPIIAALLGIALTVILYFVSPEIVPTTSWLHAIVLGFASGLSAVGVHQIKKQMTNGGENGGT